jgi:hypothetical protein
MKYYIEYVWFVLGSIFQYSFWKDWHACLNIYVEIEKEEMEHIGTLKNMENQKSYCW